MKKDLRCTASNRCSKSLDNFITVLQICAKQRDLQKGASVHAEILQKRLLEKDCFVANTLISMYVKCGALAKAWNLLENLSTRDVVSWNALITGYAQENVEEAFNCFGQMQEEGLCPDAFTFSCILKACGNIRDLEKGRQIHAELAKHGLLRDNVVLGNAVLYMYVKCGALDKAWDVFEDLPARNVITWSMLIKGYAEEDWHQEEALHFFKQMQEEGHSPDAVTFVCILEACGNTRALGKGKEIHIEICRQGLIRDNILLGNALVDMYVKCSLLAEAQEVLEDLLVRDVVTWSALIGGYVQQERFEEVLDCFEQMQHESLFPDAVTFMCILNACGSIDALEKGKKIHAEISRQGLFRGNIALGNAIVDMYVKCGALAKAKEVIEGLAVRDEVTWNVLLRGYIQEEWGGEEALSCFEWMQCEGYSPCPVSFICILKACGSIGALDRGEQIHSQIIREGYRKDVMLGSALVDMYVKCGAVAKACQVFESLAARDVVTWSALMSGYNRVQGHSEEVLNCFEWMQHEGHSPTAVTFLCILKACGSIRALDKGKEIHADIMKKGLLQGDVALGNALVDMYIKCGALAKAQQVFECLSIWNVDTWNTIIAGYVAEKRHAQEVLNYYEWMKHEGYSCDGVTFTCILKACGSIRALDKGEQVHAEVAKLGLLDDNIVVSNSLIDMYMKCGMFSRAQEVLENLLIHNVITWNTMVAGYAQYGCSIEALSFFEQMQCNGFSPNVATFVSVLTACSHYGLVDQGVMYFATMSTLYGVEPLLEHYVCLVDLFGRAGCFEKAAVVTRHIPFFDHPLVWLIFLSACRKWGNVKLGKWAFDHILQLDRENSSVYVCIRNIYAAAGQL